MATTTTLPQPDQSRIDRLSQQRDEWQNYTCVELCDVVERILRDLYAAAMMTAKARGSRDVDGLFHKMIIRLPTWSDQELIEEFSDSPTTSMEERKKKAERVEEYIKTTVWAQATLMSLSCGKHCREVIRVPNAASFLRGVLSDVAFDHETRVFGTSSLAERAELKKWINGCIKKKLLSLVPVVLFVSDSTDLAKTAADAAADAVAAAEAKTAASAGESVLECKEESCEYVPQTPKNQSEPQVPSTSLDPSRTGPTGPEGPRPEPKVDEEEEEEGEEEEDHEVPESDSEPESELV
jgi:hypothetical protein